ncbi:MAG: tetratricopeptide repeat protein, partial [Actinomycetota bacterium]|nr:tetratricopeptide repeat protein [Actinomycetota bacterium]
WVEEPVTESARPPRRSATKPARPAQNRRSRSGRKLPADVADEIGGAVDPAVQAKVERRLAKAAAAFEDDRPQDAYRALRDVLRQAESVPAARELAGLSLYRLGRWAEAAKQLEAFRALTGSVEQHPVLADTYRALGRYDKVEELWDELRAVSPHPALVAEGRIVAAGALADQGQLRPAIKLLERSRAAARPAPTDYHLRLWYALADLYERAGDAPKARELFGRVVEAEPGFAEAAERLGGLN